MSAFEVFLRVAPPLIIGAGLAVLGTILVWGAYRALRAERQRWRILRDWIEYRSDADRRLFPPDPNLEQRINRLAQSHTEPLRRRLEALETIVRPDQWPLRLMPEPVDTGGASGQSRGPER